jgi:MoaA/NifB/PqqE/SkfB family radical SAM enzyme
MIKNVKKILVDCHIVSSILKNRPAFAGVLMTHRCNLKCKFCVFWKRPVDIKKEMTLEDHKKFSSICKMLGVRAVNLAGGEPFVRKDLYEIVRMYSQDHIVIINSNGTLINQDNARLIWEAGVDVMNISIDAFHEDMHDDFRGTGVYQKAMKSIQYLKSARTRKDQRISIQAIYSPQVADQFEDFLVFCDKEEIEFACNPYRPDDEHEIKLEFSTDYSAEHLFELKRKHSSFKISDYTINKTGEFIKDGKVPNCKAGKQFFMIDPYGNIVICENYVEDRDVLLNINDTNFSIDRIKSLLEYAYENNKCEKCYARERGDLEYLYDMRNFVWLKDLLSQTKFAKKYFLNK